MLLHVAWYVLQNTQIARVTLHIPRLNCVQAGRRTTIVVNAQMVKAEYLWFDGKEGTEEKVRSGHDTLRDVVR
jgi:hypothetical protein